MEWKLFDEDDKNTHPPIGSVCLIHMDEKENYVFGYKVVEILGYHIQTMNEKDNDPFDVLTIECKDLDADEYNPHFDPIKDARILWDIDIKKYVIINTNKK